MNIPGWVRPGDEVTTFGHFFQTPIVAKGWSWLPVNELIAWVGFSWWLLSRHAEVSLASGIGWGFVTMVIFLGSEWCHNFAHAYAAHRVGKPVNAIRVLFGMPLLAYFSEDEQVVTPSEHIIRAAGGPLFNGAVTLLLALPWYSFSQPGNLSRDMAAAFLVANAGIALIGLTPIPQLDGGPILKWAQVARGLSVEQAERNVRRANLGLAVFATLLAVWLFVSRRWLFAVFVLMIAILALLVALDLIQHDN